MPDHLNPDMFFYADGTNIVLWDFKNHRQFSVDEEHFDRIIQLARTGVAPDPHASIDCALIDAGVILQSAVERPDWGWDILSRIFHVGTRDIPQEVHPATEDEWAVQYVADCQELVTRLEEVGGTSTRTCSIALPAPSSFQGGSGASLREALVRRRTCRDFLARPVALAAVSEILYYSLANIAERGSSIHEYVPEPLRMRRTSPSGGGLNSTSAFVLARNVEGLPAGVYRYFPLDHSLEPIVGSTSIDQVSFGDLFMGQHFSNDIAFGVFLVGEFDKMWWKYPHSRAYRVGLLEAGHISQTIQLVATTLGLGTWLTAAFHDSVADSLLALDSPAKQPLLFVGAGHSNGNSLDKARRKVLESK
jgi:SagB-type dehydrogenase family enzyme